MLAGLDRVDRLARHIEAASQFGLAPPAFGAQHSQAIVHCGCTAQLIISGSAMVTSSANAMHPHMMISPCRDVIRLAGSSMSANHAEQDRKAEQHRDQ